MKEKIYRGAAIATLGTTALSLNACTNGETVSAAPEQAPVTQTQTIETPAPAPTHETSAEPGIDYFADRYTDPEIEEYARALAPENLRKIYEQNPSKITEMARIKYSMVKHDKYDRVDPEKMAEAVSALQESYINSGNTAKEINEFTAILREPGNNYSYDVGLTSMERYKDLFKAAGPIYIDDEFYTFAKNNRAQHMVVYQSDAPIQYHVNVNPILDTGMSTSDSFNLKYNLNDQFTYEGQDKSLNLPKNQVFLNEISFDGPNNSLVADSVRVSRDGSGMDLSAPVN